MTRIEIDGELGRWEPLWRFAAALGCRQKELRDDLLAAGLPVLGIGGEWQVRPADVQALVARRAQEAEDAAQARAVCTKGLHRQMALQRRGEVAGLRQQLGDEA